MNEKLKGEAGIGAAYGSFRSGSCCIREISTQPTPNDSGNTNMEFFNSAVGVLQTLVIALGAGLGIWGAINLLEGYGNDNPGANAHVR